MIVPPLELDDDEEEPHPIATMLAMAAKPVIKALRLALPIFHNLPVRGASRRPPAPVSFLRRRSLTQIGVEVEGALRVNLSRRRRRCPGARSKRNASVPLDPALTIHSMARAGFWEDWFSS